MKNTLPIAIIGGTGKSGKFLVNQCISQNIPIKMLVRNPERVPDAHPLIDIVHGDARNPDHIRTLLKGCKAVISTLGMGLPANDPKVFSQSTENLIQAMAEEKITRYVLITGINVNAIGDNKGPQTKAATDWMYANFPVSTGDKQLEYELLCKSNLDWTLVRLPMIELSDENGKLSVALDDCPGNKINAVNLSKFLISQLDDFTYVRKAPFIASE